MQRRCPDCQSLNVRRSSGARGDDSPRPIFRSPYRCRDCKTRFWAIGTKVYQRIIVAVAVNLAFFTVVFGFVTLFVD